MSVAKLGTSRTGMDMEDTATPRDKELQKIIRNIPSNRTIASIQLASTIVQLQINCHKLSNFIKKKEQLNMVTSFYLIKYYPKNNLQQSLTKKLNHFISILNHKNQTITLQSFTKIKKFDNKRYLISLQNFYALHYSQRHQKNLDENQTKLRMLKLKLNNTIEQMAHCQNKNLTECMKV